MTLALVSLYQTWAIFFWHERNLLLSLSRLEVYPRLSTKKQRLYAHSRGHTPNLLNLQLLSHYILNTCTFLFSVVLNISLFIYWLCFSFEKDIFQTSKRRMYLRINKFYGFCSLRLSFYQLFRSQNIIQLLISINK